MHKKYSFVLMLCIIECGAGECRIDSDMSSLFVALFLLVPSLQQTVPPGGIAVCPLSTVQYTCVADSEHARGEQSGSDCYCYIHYIAAIKCSQ